MSVLFTNDLCPGCGSTSSQDEREHAIKHPPPSPTPPPVDTGRPFRSVSTVFIGLAILVPLLTALFGVSSGSPEFRVSAHNIEQASGSFSWRFFEWGIIEGDKAILFRGALKRLAELNGTDVSGCPEDFRQVYLHYVSLYETNPEFSSELPDPGPAFIELLRVALKYGVDINGKLVSKGGRVIEAGKWSSRP